MNKMADKTDQEIRIDNSTRHFLKEKHAYTTEISNQIRKLELFIQMNQGYRGEEERLDFIYPVVLSWKRNWNHVFGQCFVNFYFFRIELSFL